ncbi:MAG: prepilin-type N-terminal cleavage/methylation domain-containing protein [Planctomycetes bacterium]|nr:prepilin-type N-terminal cleavage/methylation domain-containing protein [Planctomycetota bacterium]
MSPSRRGFSLTEILVTLTILVILVLLIVYACVIMSRMSNNLVGQQKKRTMAPATSRVEVLC